MPKRDDANNRKLVHKEEEEYGEAFFQEHLLEQYKIVRGRIVDIIDDRNTQNKFILTILTALLAIPFLLITKTEGKNVTYSISIAYMICPFIGAVVSWHWARWNRTFGEALQAAYLILKEIEVYLPAQPFTLEDQYRIVAGTGQHKKTTAFTILMARIFLVGNIALALALAGDLFERRGQAVDANTPEGVEARPGNP